MSARETKKHKWYATDDCVGLRSACRFLEVHHTDPQISLYIPVASCGYTESHKPADMELAQKLVDALNAVDERWAKDIKKRSSGMRS